jgi:hypothetical protein
MDATLSSVLVMGFCQDANISGKIARDSFEKWRRIVLPMASILHQGCEFLHKFETREEKMACAVRVRGFESEHDIRTITRVDLDLTVRTDCAKHSEIFRAANEAKADCTVSRLIRANINLTVRIEGCSHFSVA